MTADAQTTVTALNRLVQYHTRQEFTVNMVNIIRFLYGWGGSRSAKASQNQNL